MSGGGDLWEIVGELFSRPTAEGMKLSVFYVF